MALTDNLIAFYGLSDLTDSSGNNRHLTPNGDVSFVTGKTGNCFQAAGPGGYLTAEFDGSSWNEFSLSFWAKVTAEMYPNIIYQMDIFGPNNMPLGYVEGLDLRPFGVSHQTNAVVNEWNHFVISARGGRGESWHQSAGNATIYKNGAIFPCPDLNFNDFALVINGIKIGTSGEMQTSNMQIDSFGIWNRALSGTEASELNNNGYGGEIVNGAWVPTPPPPTLVKLQAPVKFFGNVKFAV